jgi:hypothetical protein
VRIGAMDLKIAATDLAHDVLLPYHGQEKSLGLHPWYRHAIRGDSVP